MCIVLSFVNAKNLGYAYRFYRMILLQSAVYALAVCLSVCHILGVYQSG